MNIKHAFMRLLDTRHTFFYLAAILLFSQQCLRHGKPKLLISKVSVHSSWFNLGHEFL